MPKSKIWLPHKTLGKMGQIGPDTPTLSNVSRFHVRYLVLNIVISDCIGV